MFDQLIKSRRSIRKFTDQKIEAEKIDRLLKSALEAPSSRSIYPCEFVAVTDKELLEKLSQCRDHGSKFLKDAPLAIVVLADGDLSDVWIEDASIAATFIQLMAEDLGLASCWIQGRNRFYRENVKVGDYIGELLKIPKKYSTLCMIAIGYPDEVKKPRSDERLLTQKLHYNQF